MNASTASALRRLLESLDARPEIRNLVELGPLDEDRAIGLGMEDRRWLRISDDTADALRDLDVSGALLELDALAGS